MPKKNSPMGNLLSCRQTILLYHICYSLAEQLCMHTLNYKNHVGK